MANSSEPLLSPNRFDSCGAGACGKDALLVDRGKFQKLLELAERHVAEAAAISQHQEQLIREMRDRGDNTELAQSLLERLRTTARAMVEHQTTIERQLREMESGNS